MTPIIVNGVCLGYSLNFTGPDAEVSLVGDLVTRGPLLPVQPSKQAAKEPKHRVDSVKPATPRPPCYQCGRPTTIHSGKLCGHCRYELDLERGYKTDRKTAESAKAGIACGEPGAGIVWR